MRTGYPVLLLGFNRPVETAKLIEAIKRTNISHLYVWLDGPRPENESDLSNCAGVRNLVDNTRFAFPVTTHYLPANQGCRSSVSQGISWFFSQVSAGIILEDDCEPSEDFFSFMNQMLERYENDPSVMSVSGHMRFAEWSQEPETYHFSKYPNIWGWASWSRVWEMYDVDISAWGQLRGTDWLRKDVGLSPDAERYWSYKFDTVWKGEKDTWDYQLTFLSFLSRAKNVMPHLNFISNIGFGERATHTKEERPEWLISAYQPLGEIIHPEKVEINFSSDRETELKIFRTKRSLFELLGLLPAIMGSIMKLRKAIP